MAKSPAMMHKDLGFFVLLKRNACISTGNTSRPLQTASATTRPLSRLPQSPFSTLIWPGLTVLLSLLAAALIFKDYMWAPNRYMYAFGGDALVIYYDMIFHAAFDHGNMLRGMNYPYGEFVFLTDAQGAFGTVLQWIHRHLFPVSDCIPGIIHCLNIYLLPVSSLMVFYILRYFGVRNPVGSIFSVLITFMSPAMLRFSGHFGLAYPFLIPMAMLWFLRKYRHPHPEWRDALVLGILTFFSFNNPYTGINSAGFLAVAGTLLLVISMWEKSSRLRGWLVLWMGLLPLLIPYLVFHRFDPVDDRIREQWGFFYYNASPEGLLFPQGSIVYDRLRALGAKVEPVEFEQMINLGFVTILLCTLYFLHSLWFRVKGHHHQVPNPGKKGNRLVLVAATVLFLVAANSNIIPMNAQWMEEHLGPFLMFKASGRIGWPFYFALSITGVVFLDRILQTMKTRLLSYIIILILTATWWHEIRNYVSPRYEEVFHANFFHPEKEKEMLDLADMHQLDTSTYQAILVLPKMMAWTDMFLSEINWAAQFYSMRLSAATGLPMISAMLSRMSVSQTAEAIQMLSHPIIRKDLVGKFPNRKDLLLLVGSGYTALTIGEQYLVDNANPIFESEAYSLYSLSPDSLMVQPYQVEAQQQYTSQPAMPENTLHISFDDVMGDVSFYGTGSFLAPPGQTVLLNQPIPSGTDSVFVFSVWTKIDYHQPAVIDWDLRVKAPTGQILSNQRIETRRSNDIQDMWIRSEGTFNAPAGSILEAAMSSNKAIYVDEVWVYPKGQQVIHDDPEEPDFLFNGYKVPKPTLSPK